MAAEGTAAVQPTAEKEAVPSGRETVVYGKQPQAQPVTEPAQQPQEESFDTLISGRYKKDFENRVQSILSKRLKSRSDAEDQMEKLRPFLEMQARRAGVDENDTDAIIRAMESNSDFLDQYAEEHGYTPEEAKRVFALEKEHRAMVRQNDQRKAQEAYQQVLQQAQETARDYPGFDFNAEMQDGKFAQLVGAGIHTSAAYVACHPEVILQKQAAAASEAEQKTVNAVAANLTRPIENGVSGAKGAVVKDDPRTYTKDDRQKIRDIVKRGGKIYL